MELALTREAEKREGSGYNYHRQVIISDTQIPLIWVEVAAIARGDVNAIEATADSKMVSSLMKHTLQD